MENYKSSTVIYESAYSAIEYLQDNTSKWEAIKGLLRYGFYGEPPESENPFINMIYTQAIPSMKSAKQRYEKAVSDGKKGGRPTGVSTEEIITMKSNGMTNKQIAERIGCTTKNIENRVAIYNKSHPNNPNNLSVSVSDTVSVSSSVSVACAKKREEEKIGIKELLESMNCNQLSVIKQLYDEHTSYKEIAEMYGLTYFDSTQFVELYDEAYQKQYNIEHAEEIAKQKEIEKQLWLQERKEQEALSLALAGTSKFSSKSKKQRELFEEIFTESNQLSTYYDDDSADCATLQVLAELTDNQTSSDIDSW